MNRTGKLMWLPLLVLLCSCDRDRVFEENIELQNYEWPVANEPSFTFEITDEKQAYDVFINVRNSATYPYHNLYAKHILYGADGKMINSALHNLYLSDPKTGKPTGKGMGDIFDHRVRFLRNVMFTRPGKYTIKLQQYMRVDPLPGIMAVGLRVANAEDQK